MTTKNKGYSPFFKDRKALPIDELRMFINIFFETFQDPIQRQNFIIVLSKYLEKILDVRPESAHRGWIIYL